MKFSSSLLENAVLEFSRLPGIGKKTALRLVLHLLKQDIPQVEKFSQAISDLRKGIQFCSVCFNISDEAVCGICHDSTRRNSTICVVENIRDVMAIEATQQYRSGLYHVLDTTTYFICE
jgi:recombination protein RecR